MSKLNKYKHPGAKRLMLEALELKDNTEDYCAQPLDDNLFEWHFTVRGPPDTPFEGGFYHGRLSFPSEYPMKPPSIILLTPNGRFQTNKKICLSISGYHPETWQPSWSVRTALLALIAFMPTKSNRAIGSLDFSDAERKMLALGSRKWRCESCGLIKDLLRQPNSMQNPKVTPTINRDAPGAKEFGASSSSDGTLESRANESIQSTDRAEMKASNDKSHDDPKGTSCNEVQRLQPQNQTNIQTNPRQQQSYSPFLLKSVVALLLLLLFRRIFILIMS